ncbi:hypothetical protein B9479_006558 [Cryptococcus floricola]|uniref:Bromo domain-containing protein n=1 Tax=Cryptococcus floricola TaxID=2591691 RepID=A0A5D3AMX0_9TREE|nr:hypothetical protein B9479_006558 [Cryptococcus floricola]
MPSHDPPKIPPIKLKLTLGPAPATPAPPPPVPTSQVSNGSVSTPLPKIKLNTGNVSGPSSLRIDLPAPGGSDSPLPAPPGTASPAALMTPTQPQRQKTASTKKVGRPSTKKKVTVAKRPSAIPPRLLATSSATPSRQMAPTMPETPTLDGTSTSPDVLSLPLSPSSQGLEFGSPQPFEEETPSRRAVKWSRTKKPLKELLQKIMIELRKKDEYALFEEPVDTQAYPDYLERIGGEDKAMDMGTMQAKVDNNEYRSLDQVEADLRKLVEAAHKFNAEHTTPYKSASNILSHGLKHIERARPIAITPPPSPVRVSATPVRATSVVSTRDREQRETTVVQEERVRDHVPPLHYIPEEMLNFPPNSAMARAVGWNLNGGKRVYNKRISRAREKFSGKWRNWLVDGSRDIAEAEEIHQLFEPWRLRSGDQWREFIDWQAMRNKDGWWELEMAQPPPHSAAQQAPLPFNPATPRHDQVSHKTLSPWEYGQYPSVASEVAFLRQRIPSITDDDEILAEHIRPMYTRARRGDPPAPTNLVNVFDGPLKRSPGDWVRDLVTGDVIGEAYLDSLDRFVKGAMESVEGEEKPDYPLDEYVFDHYHEPLLQSSTRKLVHDTLRDLSAPNTRASYSALGEAAYSRVALRYLTRPANPMDIQPLLREEGDFMYQGVGGKSGVNVGLEWTGKEMSRLVEKQRRLRGVNSSVGDKRKREVEDETETKRVKTEDDAAVSEDTETRAEPSESEEATAEELKQLRLELVALSKFYPLPALKKMSKEDAALLPVNVRGLMCRQ